MALKRRYYEISFLTLKFHGLESEIQMLRTYDLTMQAAIHREQNDLAKFVDQQKTVMTETEFAEFLEYQLIDTYWELNDYIPQLLRATTFVAIMSLLESELVGLCRIIQRKKNISVKYRKIKHKTTLDSIREYIQTHTGMNIGANPRWKTLDTLNTIRNAIVHSDGRISDKGISHKADQIRNYARRNPNLLRVSGRKSPLRNRVELKADFLTHVLDLLSKYGKAAHKRLRPLRI